MERKNLQKSLDIIAGTTLVTETILLLASPGFQEMISANPAWAIPAILSLGYIFGRVLGKMPIEGEQMLGPIPPVGRKKSTIKPKK